MKEGYVIRNQELPHFLTITVVDWIDAFSRKSYRESVIESCRYCISNKGMVLMSYVIMSNHIHLVVQSDSGALSDLIRDFKKFTASTILKKLRAEPESRRHWMLDRFRLAAKTHVRNQDFQFWQLGNHAEEIYSEEFLWTKINYIHSNPVRAGIVANPQDYLYSSASNYINGQGILEVAVVPNPVVNVLKPGAITRYLSYE